MPRVGQPVGVIVVGGELRGPCEVARTLPRARSGLRTRLGATSPGLIAAAPFPEHFQPAIPETGGGGVNAEAWTVISVGVALATLIVVLAVLARPWMRDAAREAADSLYARLKENDFKHVEDRIDHVESQGREDRVAMEGRLRADMVAMEARLTAAILRQPGAPPPKDSPPDGDA